MHSVLKIGSDGYTCAVGADYVISAQMTHVSTVWVSGKAQTVTIPECNEVESFLVQTGLYGRLFGRLERPKAWEHFEANCGKLLPKMEVTITY